MLCYLYNLYSYCFALSTERTWFDCISLLVMPCITIMWQIKKPWTLNLEQRQRERDINTRANSYSSANAFYLYKTTRTTKKLVKGTSFWFLNEIHFLRISKTLLKKRQVGLQSFTTFVKWQTLLSLKRKRGGKDHILLWLQRRGSTDRDETDRQKRPRLG